MPSGRLRAEGTITLGGGDDTYDDRLARTDWPVADVDAGDGNDTINGSYGSRILRGGNGNDTLRGIAANYQIDGGPGDDTSHGGAARIGPRPEPASAAAGTTTRTSGYV